MHFHKAQEKPQRWGNFQDVQYAIRKNAEKIYQVDSDSIVLCIPLFWGLPPLDYSGFNNHGINYGSVYKDRSLDLDGANDYVDVPDFDVTNTISISVRIKSVISDPEWAHAVSRHPGWFLSGHSNTNIIRFGVTNISNVEVEATFGTYANIGTNWHYYTGVYDGSNVITYLDGLQKNSSIQSGNIKLTGNTRIGTYWNNGGDATWFWNGPIDEVRISNVARTEKQIALFHDRPWDLYRPVSKPVYSLPAVGVTIPVFMQNMRGGFNPISRGGFIN